MVIRTLFCILVAGLYADGQVLWKEPPPFNQNDWLWGPGGKESAPRPPFTFVKEKFGGTNPKVEVRDDTGRHWVVKFGSEVHAETFMTRLVSALGYAAEPTYYVDGGSIDKVYSSGKSLKRARYFVARDGSFHDARFKLRTLTKDEDNQNWSWAQNPFVGSPELGGLKVLVMLTSNWDTKDSRDGAGESNTGTIRADANSAACYAVTDWGATLGRASHLLQRNRWDWEGYRLETSRFVRLTPDGKLLWRYKGRHSDDITAGVTPQDVRWLLHRFSAITDENLQTGLEASGASESVAREYTRLIRDRLTQLQTVADTRTIQRIAK